MATAKPPLQPQDNPAASPADAAGTSEPSATPTPADYTTSPTWGQGGRFIINGAGDRVPAPDQE